MSRIDLTLLLKKNMIRVLLFVIISNVLPILMFNVQLNKLLREVDNTYIMYNNYALKATRQLNQ
jgi:hypothetical protein